VLRRIVPPGYQSVDAVRAMPLGTANTQSHGGLAFVFRQATVRVQKRHLDVSPTPSTFEYLCGYVSTSHTHFFTARC